MKSSSLIRFSLIAGMIIALSACATDVANRYYASTTYTAKQPEQVEILRQSPSRPYEVIADFQSRGDSVKSVRNKAAKIGADAVIISTLGGYYERAEEWASGDAQSNTYSRICGTAIRYKQQNQKNQ